MFQRVDSLPSGRRCWSLACLAYLASHDILETARQIRAKITPPPRRSSPKFARVIMSPTRTNCELLCRLDKGFRFGACATLHTPFLGYFSCAGDEFLPILYRQDANSYVDAKYDKRCGFALRSACVWGHVTKRSGRISILNAIQREMLQVITEERMGVGSSRLVERWAT